MGDLFILALYGSCVVLVIHLLIGAGQIVYAVFGP